MSASTQPSIPKATAEPTPLRWRVAIFAGILGLASTACFLEQAGAIGPKIRSAFGMVAFIGLALGCSADLRRINWRTVAWGIGLQLLLALLILKFEVGGRRPVFELFEVAGRAIAKFLEFSLQGAQFVFGIFADPEEMGKVFKTPDGKPRGFIFACVAMPTVIFVSAFFTVLYHYGILQVVVRLMARAMAYLLRTSGAETLSVSANVFLGQTEAPLIVRPYIQGMTRSELLAMMVGGMAHISGGVMAVYIQMGADPVAILATSIMAAPASLYLSKIILPETGEPQTLGTTKVTIKSEYRYAMDALSAGASEGMRLAINIIAMLIAFIAAIALVDALLGACSEWVGTVIGGFPKLSLTWVFSKLFAPISFLMGVDMNDVPRVADLLGKKLVLNEFVAYADLTENNWVKDSALPGGGTVVGMDPRSYKLAAYALTGFANIASIGIQIGGIGGMAPNRREDLARLGWRALFTGFLATLVNASIAGMLL
jgi:concentrative nucleoside transporter, CNT family